MTTTVAISKGFLLLKCLLLTEKKWHQDKQMIESSASYCQWKEFCSENSQDNSYYQLAGWWVALKESIRCSSLNRLTIPQLRGKMTINSKHLLKFYQYYPRITCWPNFCVDIQFMNQELRGKEKKNVSEQYNPLHNQEQLLSHTYTCTFSWDYCYIKM